MGKNFLLILMFLPLLVFADATGKNFQQEKKYLAQPLYKQQRTEQIKIINKYDYKHYDKEIARIYQHISSENDMSARVAKISQLFLGKLYLLDALGEGPNATFDKDPLYRTDAFDCTTFVETVLALAQAKNLEDFKKVKKSVSYQNGTVDFVYRNHFISVDWNKDNINNGYLRDITDQLGAPYKIAAVKIDKPSWYQKLSANQIKLFAPLNAMQTEQLLNDLHDNSQKVQVEIGKIKYIPLTELFYRQQGKLIPKQQVFDAIPSGSIIEIVFPNFDLRKKIGTHLDVLHMGLAIRTPQGLMFREASSVKRQVADIPLSKYLQRIYPYASRYSAGINVQQII